MAAFARSSSRSLGAEPTSKVDSARPRPPASATIASSRSSSPSGSSGASSSRTSSTIGRARGRAALVVRASPGEPEALLRSREADREQVAVLDLGLLPLGQAQRPASVVREQRPAGVAPREVAVLHGADEHVGHPARAGAVGADHADPALGRTAPHRHVEIGDGGDHVTRGMGETELREVGERPLDLGTHPELESPVLLRHRPLRGAQPTPRSSEPACPPRAAAPAPTRLRAAS